MDQAGFIAGRYELRFAVADYFRARGQGAEVPYLDVVTLAVGLMADEGHYHVPLLCSPWSYATYRGS
jgi:5-hydroxyisourate hydrolase